MRKIILLMFTCYVLFAVTAQAKTTILVFGDSLSAAYNIQPEDGWVSLLENRLTSVGREVEFINASISGETTSGGIARFAKQINKSNPHIVVLELGANDGLRGSSLVTMRENLTKMIELSQKNQSQILLAGMHIPPNYGRTYTRKFDQIFTDLAKMDNVTLIPFLLEDVATKSELIQADGLHPNEKGQPIISKTVESYLVPLLKD